MVVVRGKEGGAPAGQSSWWWGGGSPAVLDRLKSSHRTAEEAAGVRQGKGASLTPPRGSGFWQPRLSPLRCPWLQAHQCRPGPCSLGQGTWSQAVQEVTELPVTRGDKPSTSFRGGRLGSEGGGYAPSGQEQRQREQGIWEL